MATTQVRTNSNAFKNAFNKHLIEVLYCEDDTEGKDLATVLAFVARRFESEHNSDYEKKWCPNTQQRFSNWLAGGALATHIWTEDIRDFLDSIGGERPKATDAQAYAFYHNKFYMQFVELCRHNNVSINF